MSAQLRLSRSIGLGLAATGTCLVGAAGLYYIWRCKEENQKPAWLRKIMPSNTAKDDTGVCKPDVIPENEKGNFVPEEKLEEANNEYQKKEGTTTLPQKVEHVHLKDSKQADQKNQDDVKPTAPTADQSHGTKEIKTQDDSPSTVKPGDANKASLSSPELPSKTTPDAPVAVASSTQPDQSSTEANGPKSAQMQREFPVERELKLSLSPGRSGGNSNESSDVEVLSESNTEAGVGHPDVKTSRIPVRKEAEISLQKSPQSKDISDNLPTTSVQGASMKVSPKMSKPIPQTSKMSSIEITDFGKPQTVSSSQKEKTPEASEKRPQSVSAGEKTVGVHLDTKVKVVDTAEKEKSKASSDQLEQVETGHVKHGSGATKPDTQHLGKKSSEPERPVGDSVSKEPKTDSKAMKAGDESLQEDTKDAQSSKPSKETSSEVSKTADDATGKCGQTHAETQDETKAKKKKKKKRSLGEKVSGFFKDIADKFDSSSDEDSDSSSSKSSSSESDGSIQDTKEMQSIIELRHPTLGQTKIPMGCSLKTICEIKKRKIVYQHLVTDVESENFASKIGFESSTDRYQQFIIAVNNIHTEFMDHDVLLAHLQALNIEESIQVTLKKWTYTGEDEVTEECVDLAFKFYVSDEGELKYTVLQCKPFTWRKNLEVKYYGSCAGQKQPCFIQHVATTTYLKVEDGLLMMANLQDTDDTPYKFDATIFFGKETGRGACYENQEMFVFTFSSDSELKHYLAPTRQDRSGFCEVGLLALPGIDLETVKELKTQTDHRFFYHHIQHDQTHIFESSIYADTYLASKGHSLFMKTLPKSRVSNDKDICFHLHSALHKQ